MKNSKIYFLLSFCLFIQGFENSYAQTNYRHTLDSLKKEMYRNHEPANTMVIHYNLSVVYLELGDFNMSENYGKKAKIEAKELKRDTAYLEISEHMGNLYMNFGDYSKSIDEFQEALRITQKWDDKTRMAFVNGNIGTNHWYMGNFDEALKYYKKSLQLSELVDDFDGMSGQLNNIGLIYRQQGNLETALRYYTQSLNLCKKINNDFGYANALNNMGIVYQYQKKFEEAIAAYQESLEIRRALDDKVGVSTSLGNLGAVSALKKEYALAEKYFLEAYEISENVNDLEGIKEISYNLADIYEMTGRKEEAYDYFKIYIATRDSLNDEENKKEAYQKDLKFKFETDRLEMEKEREKEEIRNRESEKTQRIILFSVIGGSLMVILFAVLIYRRFRESKKQNGIIAEQKKLVEAKHKEITDSINYAERIQRSFLASKKSLDENLKENFVLFKPKDVVSGDFYWSSQLKNGNFALVCADSTGHGVPGAIMSILNISSLEKAVENETEPSKILDETRRQIIERLKKDGSKDGGRDGMDGILLSFDFQKMNLSFAMANIPLWICRNGEMTEFTPDKMPVGKHDMDITPFSSHQVKIENGDMLYIFTDGYADQFGGPSGKKFKYVKLKELLTEISKKDMDSQLRITNEKFEEWKGELEQVDDMCILGIKL